jgi:hypothetical protein
MAPTDFRLIVQRSGVIDMLRVLAKEEAGEA